MSKWKVANYELSLRPRELGVRQDASEWVWLKLQGKPIKLVRRDWIPDGVLDSPITECVAAAYDVAELGVALPDDVHVYRHETDWFSGAWRKLDVGCVGITAADALATMLIRLIEHGHVSVDDVNRRLGELWS